MCPYLNFRNNLLMLHKNLPAAEGKRFLVVRRLMDTLAIVMAVLKWHWGDARAIVRAHRDFRRMRDNYQPTATINLLNVCRQLFVGKHWARSH